MSDISALQSVMADQIVELKAENARLRVKIGQVKIFLRGEWPTGLTTAHYTPHLIETLDKYRRDIAAILTSPSTPPPAEVENVLEWGTDKSYWNGDDAEFAWAEGTKDLHWMARGEELSLYENEYDSAMRVSWVTGRTQEQTKAVAESLQRVLDATPKGAE
jgi:ribosomal protein L29